MDIKTKSCWHLCRLKGTSVFVMEEDSLCDNRNKASKKNPFTPKRFSQNIAPKRRIKSTMRPVNTIYELNKNQHVFKCSGRKEKLITTVSEKVYVAYGI